MRKPADKWVNLGTAYLALVATFIPYVGWSPALPTITGDLGISYSQAGSLFSFAGLLAGAAILVGGHLVRRLGSKTVVVIGLVVGVVGQFVFAAADNYSVVLAARLISGLAVGLLFVGTYTLAVDWFHESRQTGRALGVMLCGDGVGSLMALFVLGLLLTAFGWRGGLAIQGTILIAVLIIVVAVAKDVPRGSVASSEVTYPPRESGLMASIRVLRNRNVFLAVLFWIGSVGLFALISSWMPTVLVERAGWSQSVAGLVTSLYAVVGMTAAFSASAIAERLRSKQRVVLLAGILATVSVGLIAIALGSENYVLAAVCVPLAGLAIYAGEPLVLGRAVESTDPSEAGLVNGLVVGVPWMLSGFAYPYLMGMVRDVTGSFTGGFMALAGTTAVFCVISPLFINESGEVTVALGEQAVV